MVHLIKMVVGACGCICVQFNNHVSFDLQTGEGREFYFKGKVEKKPAVDLMIADFPDGLRIPGISDPSSQVPHWNEHIPDFLQVMMSFANAYLHDDGAFLLFYHGGSTVKKEISGYLKNYNFKIKDEWTIINDMHLANPTNQEKHVSHS